MTWVTTNFPLVDGALQYRGIDLFALTPARGLNLIYHLMTRNLEAKDKEQLDNELERPRPGEDPDDGVWAPEALASDFDKAIAAQAAPNAPKPKKAV